MEEGAPSGSHKEVGMSVSLPVLPLRANNNFVVTSSRFFNFGTQLTGKPLGYLNMGIAWVNAVELQFFLNPSEASAYRNIEPKQWAGPDKVSVKYGNPLTSPWQTHSENVLGSGPDDPVPQNQLIRQDVVAFYDSPGPTATMFPKAWPSRIYAVQNFTAWINGTDSAGWTRPLCGVLAWYSVVHIANEHWAAPNVLPNYLPYAGNQSGTGWFSTQTLPPV
jgi:hypothetical protein